MKKSEIFWEIFGIIFLLIGNYTIYSFATKADERQKETRYCGIITKKSEDETKIKHGVRTELYLIVDFEKIGTKAINVDPNTYFTNNKGDAVCFKLNDYDINNSRKDSSILSEILLMIKFLIMIITLMGDLVLFVSLIVISIEFINKKLDE